MIGKAIVLAAATTSVMASGRDTQQTPAHPVGGYASRAGNIVEYQREQTKAANRFNALQRDLDNAASDMYYNYNKCSVEILSQLLKPGTDLPTVLGQYQQFHDSVSAQRDRNSALNSLYSLVLGNLDTLRVMAANPGAYSGVKFRDVEIDGTSKFRCLDPK